MVAEQLVILMSREQVQSRCMVSIRGLHPAHGTPQVLLQQISLTGTDDGLQVMLMSGRRC